MLLIKFNSDSKHYYKCSECSYNGTKATITGIESYPSSLEGGFGVFEYSDIERKKTRLVEDLSRFSLVWEQDENTLVFSSDKQTYRTYFIYNEDGFITSEVTGTRIIEENALLADSGIGREHEEYEHIELFDEDGFYLYKVVDGQKVSTTAEEKAAWVKEHTYSIYYGYNDNNYVDSAIAVLEDITEEKHIFVRKQFSSKGIPVIEDKLFDEDGFYIYKVVENKVVETTAEDKQAWREEQAAAQLLSAKEAKIAEISRQCAKATTDGVTVNGAHYSYQLTDQNNLSNAMNLAIQTGLDVPYHADTENCKLYTKEELTTIYIAAELNVTGQVTYNNQMKQYIYTLATVEEVNAVQYGDELKGEYLETYNVMMKQAEEVIKKLVNA